MNLLFDAESNGLLYEATQLWVISCIDIDTLERRSFYGDELEDGLRYLMGADHLIGHNIIDYDYALFQKLYPWWIPPNLTTDTYILSALLNPDRIGGHGIEAWGRRLGGEQKEKVEDWSYFDMAKVSRCESDVRLNLKVLRALQREVYEPITGVNINE